MLEALDDASATDRSRGDAVDFDLGSVGPVGEIGRSEPARPRRLPRSWLLVAASILLLAGTVALFVANDRDVPTPANVTAGPTLPTPSEPRLSISSADRWSYRLALGEDAAVTSLVLQVDEVRGDTANFRVRNDLAGLFGFAAVDLGPPIGLPPILLDPALDLVDCLESVPIPVGNEQEAAPACDDRLEPVVEVSTREVVASDPTDEATSVVEVVWAPAGEPERTTVIFVGPTAVERIEVGRPDARPPTVYVLED
jgi:hypothetical protein